MCLPTNVNILLICIIAGALSMFSMWGCVPDIRPRECIKKYCPNTLPRELGVYWIIWSLKIMLFNIIPVASEYQEIHPYIVVNIDNVKINTTVMREWPIFKQVHMCSCKKSWFFLIRNTRNTRWFWKLIGYGSGIEKYFRFGSGIGYPLVPVLEAMFFPPLHTNSRGWQTIC